MDDLNPPLVVAFSRSAAVGGAKVPWETAVADRIVPFSRAPQSLPAVVRALVEETEPVRRFPHNLSEEALNRFAALVNASFTKREGCEQYAAWQVIWSWFLSHPRSPCPMEIIFGAVSREGDGWPSAFRPEARVSIAQVIKNLNYRLASAGGAHGTIAILHCGKKGACLTFLTTAAH